MTPLSDALVAAQRRALATLEKAYVADAIDAETVSERAGAFGISDPLDLSALLAALDVLKEWGATLPAETNGAKPETEKMSDKQRGFIEQLLASVAQALRDDLAALRRRGYEAVAR